MADTTPKNSISSYSSTNSLPAKLAVSRFRHLSAGALPVVFSSSNSEAGTPSSVERKHEAENEHRIQHLSRSNAILKKQLDECLKDLENYQSIEDEIKLLKADKQRLYSKVSVIAHQNSKINMLERRILELQTNEASLSSEIQRLRMSDKLTLCNQKDVLFERDSAVRKAEQLEKRYKNLLTDFDALRGQFLELSDSLQETRQELSMKNKEYASEMADLRRLNSDLEDKLTNEDGFWHIQLKAKDEQLERQRQVLDQLQTNNLQMELNEVTRRDLGATKNELQVMSAKFAQTTRDLKAFQKKEREDTILKLEKDRQKSEIAYLTSKNKSLRADLSALRVNVRSMIGSKDAEIRQLKDLLVSLEQKVDSLKADIFKKSTAFEVINTKFEQSKCRPGSFRQKNKCPQISPLFCEWSSFDVEPEVVLTNLLLSAPVRMDEKFEFDAEPEDIYLVDHSFPSTKL